MRKLVVAVIGLLGVVAAEPATGQTDVDPQLARWLEPQDWQRDTPGPILSLGEPGQFDDQHLHAPCVALEAGQYWMWYTGAQGSVGDRVMRLGLAASRDGREFHRARANPVLRFDDDRHSILTPTMITGRTGEPLREAGRLRLWFSSTDFHDPAQRHTLHEATSADGIRWSAPSPPQLEDCYAPTIVKQGSEYLLWYTDVAAEPWCIRHARSNDGRTWTVDPEPVLEVEQAWEQGRLFYPTVVAVEGGFVMWYGAYWSEEPNKTALGCAVSPDGRRWTRSPHNPVFRPDAERSWESHYTTSQSVMRLADGAWRIWYATRPKPPFDHKYFAIATAHWTGPARLD